MLKSNKWLLGVASAALISATATLEGTRYYAYYDLAGIPTVCSGYTGEGITFGRKYSTEECSRYTRAELIEHGTGVLNCIKNPLNENEYNSFTLMAYNVGVNGFCSSRAARLFNEGKHKEACNAIAYGPKNEPVWSYVDGKFVQGLHNRRKFEREMCLKPV